MIIAVVALAAVLGACGGRPPNTHVEAGGPLATPYPIEPFDTIGLDGEPVSLAAWKGQVVVINVWATWCAPCRREMPALAALQARHRDRVRVLGLLQDNVTDEFARQFLKAVGVSYPVTRSTFDIERRLPAVLALPTTFVLDPAGRLVAMFAAEVESAVLEREVVKALGK